MSAFDHVDNGRILSSIVKGLNIGSEPPSAKQAVVFLTPVLLGRYLRLQAKFYQIAFW